MFVLVGLNNKLEETPSASPLFPFGDGICVHSIFYYTDVTPYQTLWYYF